MTPERSGLDIRTLPRNMVANTMKILSHEDAIHKRDPDRFDVYSLRTPSRRVRVRHVGDLWKCASDKRNNQDQPCSHILAVLIYEGLVEMSSTAASVYHKNAEGRDHVLEEEAWRLVPTKLPELLARLLREGLAVIGTPVDPNPLGGRPPASTFGLLYQSIIRVAWRNNLRASEGLMASAEHRHHNPYGGVSRSTISKFLSDPKTTEILEKLLALSTWPAKPYETLVHPDGTGLTEQHFTAYFDERYAKDREKQEAKRKAKGRQKQVEYLPPVPADAKTDEVAAAVAEAARDTVAAAVAHEVEEHAKRNQPRKHQWTYTEILWTYRYTMVAAIHTAQEQFGEAPWLLPLLERASIMLDLRELGGDKAYVAHYIFEYARRHGIEPQIKLKKNATTTNTRGSLSRAYRDIVHESRIDPGGYAAKANRRNNAETGNHAFKAFLGDQIYSKHPVAQHNEILCMCIAYNLARLVFLGVDQGVEVRFAGGAQALAEADWVDLEILFRTMTYERSKTRRLAEGVADEGPA